MPSILRDDLYKPWFVDHDKWGFEVLSGDYLGVVVQLDELTVDKISQESNGIGIDLGYQLIHIPELVPIENTQNGKFIKVMDLIVNDILREAVETHREQEQNRESNT
tara:strand:+ start:4100 stop:4420 length:321 start_codon:yes stop_codon:yes gene_type:complete